MRKQVHNCIYRTAAAKACNWGMRSKTSLSILPGPLPTGNTVYKMYYGIWCLEYLAVAWVGCVRDMVKHNWEGGLTTHRLQHYLFPLPSSTVGHTLQTPLPLSHVSSSFCLSFTDSDDFCQNRPPLLVWKLLPCETAKCWCICLDCLVNWDELDLVLWPAAWRAADRTACSEMTLKLLGLPSCSKLALAFNVLALGYLSLLWMENSCCSWLCFPNSLKQRPLLPNKWGLFRGATDELSFQKTSQNRRHLALLLAGLESEIICWLFCG